MNTGLQLVVSVRSNLMAVNLPPVREDPSGTRSRLNTMILPRTADEKKREENELGVKLNPLYRRAEILYHLIPFLRALPKTEGHHKLLPNRCLHHPLLVEEQSRLDSRHLPLHRATTLQL